MSIDRFKAAHLSEDFLNNLPRKPNNEIVVNPQLVQQQPEPERPIQPPVRRRVDRRNPRSITTEIDMVEIYFHLGI